MTKCWTVHRRYRDISTWFSITQLIQKDHSLISLLKRYEYLVRSMYPCTFGSYLRLILQFPISEYLNMILHNQTIRFILWLRVDSGTLSNCVYCFLQKTWWEITSSLPVKFLYTGVAPGRSVCATIKKCLLFSQLFPAAFFHLGLSKIWIRTPFIGLLFINPSVDLYNFKDSTSAFTKRVIISHQYYDLRIQKMETSNLIAAHTFRSSMWSFERNALISSTTDS